MNDEELFRERTEIMKKKREQRLGAETKEKEQQYAIREKQKYRQQRRKIAMDKYDGVCPHCQKVKTNVISWAVIISESNEIIWEGCRKCWCLRRKYHN
jgi:hypothetical protein